MLSLRWWTVRHRRQHTVGGASFILPMSGPLRLSVIILPVDAWHEMRLGLNNMDDSRGLKPWSRISSPAVCAQTPPVHMRPPPC